jgi:hypothetical protein
MQALGLQVAYNAFLNTNKLDKAWESAKALVDLMPDSKIFQQYFMYTNELLFQREATKRIVETEKYLMRIGEGDRIKSLIKAIPSTIANNPFMVELRKKYTPPRKWGKDEIAIFCGPGFTAWNPKIMKDPKGNFVGGSEEATIHIATELSKLGWKVTVFGEPGADEGEIDGVNWLPYFHINYDDEFNIVVRWRDISFFDRDVKAKKKYVWAHDILNPLDFTEERVDKVDKIMVLSNWHRDNLPDVTDKKMMITANGI